MYERSAIVLERYMEEILELNKPYNLKKNAENYEELINKIENYQIMTEKELKVIQDFEDTVKKIEDFQKQQENLYKSNRKLEEERKELFNDLGEEPKVLESKLKKIEKSIEKNNHQYEEIREQFIQQLWNFSQKQKDRNKCEKAKRIGEAKHIEYIKQVKENFSQIDINSVVNLKDFITSEKEQVKEEALEVMTKNGKNERVAFNQEVLKKAIKARIDIAEKEAECYVLLYDKMKKIIAETENELIKLNKYKKALRDTSVKLAFLKAEKEYIVGFLDYERMSTISGARAHKKMMEEACQNFELDRIQMKNLYELILKETSNKATKKVYAELYNKTYLHNIEDKEKNFEEEVNQVNIKMGTVINSNYWRIEGIKNIYLVFQEEVSKKFEKDLSEYRVEDEEEDNEQDEEYEEEFYEEDDYEEDEYYSNEENEEDDYEEDDEYYDDYEDEEEDDDEYYEKTKIEEYEFDEEDSIEKIIEKSRKKAMKNYRPKSEEKSNNKGLFNKFFKK